MTPFLPGSVIRKIMYNKVHFRMLKLVPFNYIILARLLNTVKDSRDIEGSPHYRKYIDGALYVMRIKRFLSSKIQELPKKPNAGSGFIEDQATPAV